MNRLMRFLNPVKRDPAIEVWISLKLRPECGVDSSALTQLIEAAYADMKRRLNAKE